MRHLCCLLVYIIWQYVSIKLWSLSGLHQN